MGRSGRDGVAAHLPKLKEKLRPDVVIVNGENAAAGHGVTVKIAKDFYDMGVDCLTTGNHVWNQKELLAAIDGDPKLLRPMNFPDGTPGRGTYTHTLPDGRKIWIANIMGNLYMDQMLDNPCGGGSSGLRAQNGAWACTPSLSIFMPKQHLKKWRLPNIWMGAFRR